MNQLYDIDSLLNCLPFHKDKFHLQAPVPSSSRRDALFVRHFQCDHIKQSSSKINGRF